MADKKNITKYKNLLLIRTFELEFRPSVAAPCGSGDAELDRGWWGERPGSLSSLDRKTCGRNERVVSQQATDC